MKLSVLALALGVTFSGSAFANISVWDSTSPWDGQTTAQYAEWSFIENVNDTTPDIGSTAAASLRETTGNGYATSGGNIYSFSGPIAFQSTLSGTTGGFFDVYLRISTQGEVANTTATLNGVSATSTLAFNAAMGGAMGGSEQEVFWKWTNVAGASLYTFNFQAAAMHMSLDQVALATVAAAAVPEPETYSMMALGLGLMAFAARRSSKKA